MLQYKKNTWGEKMSSNNTAVISKASNHTIKKFELIENYVKSWAHKLLQNPHCNGVIFIDCMCNSGVYFNDKDEKVFGTPVRVAKILRDAAGQYPNKKIYIYLNDYSAEKIALLRENLPAEKSNFKYSITIKDGNALLKEIGSKLDNRKKLHLFLLYDPYDAHIDWNALSPFFRSWSEVLINHMISDSIRAVKVAKSDIAKQKYEKTYLSDFENLLPFGSDKSAYEKRVEEIINGLKGSSSREYYVASYPFFNTRNALQYDLVHCTSNKEGFKLYKTTAWKTFGGKSSIKNTHGKENQLMLDMDGSGVLKTEIDEKCYYVKDIADYIQTKFAGMKNVPLSLVWGTLDKHPVFPSDGFRKDIKNDLKNTYGARTSRDTISFGGK